MDAPELALIDGYEWMIDSESFETVARRHRDLDISDFRASRAGMAQREKKRAFARATSVHNVFCLPG